MGYAGWCSRWVAQVGVCRVVQQVGCVQGGAAGGLVGVQVVEEEVAVGVCTVVLYYVKQNSLLIYCHPVYYRFVHLPCSLTFRFHY